MHWISWTIFLSLYFCCFLWINLPLVVIIWKVPQGYRLRLPHTLLLAKIATRNVGDNRVEGWGIITFTAVVICLPDNIRLKTMFCFFYVLVKVLILWLKSTKWKFSKLQIHKFLRSRHPDTWCPETATLLSSGENHKGSEVDFDFRSQLRLKEICQSLLKSLWRTTTYQSHLQALKVGIVDGKRGEEVLSEIQSSRVGGRLGIGNSWPVSPSESEQ